jgi:DNA polymerase-2
MNNFTGWLLDLYPNDQAGITLWLLDKNGTRHKLAQAFPITFYAAGPAPRLRALWQFLKAQPIPIRLSRTIRKDLFQAEPATVLEIEVADPGAQPRLFERVHHAFPDLTYYDADLPISLRHAAIYGTFPLAYCSISTEDNGIITALKVIDSPWDLDPAAPPLRILCIEPDKDPSHATPEALLVHYNRSSKRFPTDRERPLLLNLAGVLDQLDPDLILTAWGDGWLLPYLCKLSEKWHIPLRLSRDPARSIAKRAERSYFAYGQVIYRDQQIHLFGRWHVDIYNATLYHDYHMDGIYELARVTGLPLQTVARVSPGSGISAMQMIVALRQGILVPWHKQQAENFKTAAQLMRSDLGGLVYQPTVGLHRNVAELDFISMYPSIMVHCNISPETIATLSLPGETTEPAGETTPGLIPQTLAPLLNKRIAFKLRMAELPKQDEHRRIYKARASAHKWLLVTCFGYLGYKNARFGRIEAHEAVTAYGREALLRAKEASEDHGFEILHLYVDGLWVKREGFTSAQEFQDVLDDIAARTGLPITLEGIFRWIAFLPSRVDKRVPVANRYFGVYQDGTVKARGIEIRRRDTPVWVAEMQRSILEAMAQKETPEQIIASLPGIVAYLRHCLADLKAGNVPAEKLVVAQKLSRTVAEYHSPSPAARAASQLEEIDKSLRPGQMVRFIYMLGAPGVHAWDLPQVPDLSRIDVERYAILLLRAASTLLQPFGLDEAALKERVFHKSGFYQREPRPKAIPLFHSRLNV